MKSLRFLGLMVLAAAGLHGQQYWSSTMPICYGANFNLNGPIAITDSTGATLGYSCWVSGTFLWLSAGGQWGTSIRVAAPASGAIGVDYFFYDTGGSSLTLDSTSGSGLFPTSGNEVNFALNANQASEIRLLGASSEAPHYNTNQKGSVYAKFFCPDAITCETVLPQLLYSALPSTSLSVPISWDYFFSPIQPQGAWPHWSGEGIDDGGSYRVSLVIYNQDTVPTAYTVRVYDSTGAPAGTGMTPTIPPAPLLSDGTYGEAGVYADVLSNIVTRPLPSGVFKILVDGGSNYAAVSMIQTSVLAATSIQVAYDSPPSTSSTATSALQSVRRARVASKPRQVFPTLPK